MPKNSQFGLWRSVRPVADLSKLPAEISLSPEKLHTKSLIIFGAVWLVLNAVYLVPTLYGRAQSEPIFWIFVIVSPLIGLSLLLGGLSNLVARRTLNISGTTVSFSQRSLFGPRAWQEPLSDYLGLQHETRLVAEGQYGSKTHYQVIELVHRDKRRTVPLYVQTGATVPDFMLQQYATALSLPILENSDPAA